VCGAGRGFGMKRSTIAALSGGVIAMLGASSAARAAAIGFTVTTIDGTPTYVGPTLDQSSSLDFDTSILLVTEVDPDDASGLTPGVDTVSLSPTNIDYGNDAGPMTLSAPDIVTKSWTGDDGDLFTETLTQVDSIDRSVVNQIIVRLSGMVSDTNGLFVEAPAFLVLNATQFGGVGSTPNVTFTNTANTGVVPEPSTWVMMALGFGALGYAGFRGRKSPLLSV
jgi:hypothetical protein